MSDKNSFRSQNLETKMREVESKLSWKFLGYYDITTTQQTITVPSNVNEYLVVVGRKNNYQVYGGKSYIIPYNESNRCIINIGPLYDAEGILCSQKGVYINIHNGQLIYNAFDIVSGSLLLRVYYR